MPAKEPSLDELNYIMNLQRQEAFDDTTRNDVSSPSDPPTDNETPEEKLMKIVDKPLPGIPKDRQDLIKRAQSARQKSARSRYSYSPSDSTSISTFNLYPSDSEKEEWRTTINRSQSNDVQPPQIKELRRVSSTASGNRAGGRPLSTDKQRSMNKRRPSSSSLTVDTTGDVSEMSVTSSDTRNSDGGGKRKSSKRRSSSRARPSPDTSVRSNRSLSILDRNNGSGRSAWDNASRKDESSVSSRDRRRSSSKARNEPSPRRGRRSSTTRHSESPARRERDSMKKQRSKRRMSSKDGEGRRRRSRSRPTSSDEIGGEEKFEQLWSPNSERKSYTYEEKLRADEDNPVARSSISRALTDDSKKKKTKLEKIHELQATCERYKKEWINASKEKKKFRQELQSVQVDIVSLNMEIDTHKAETDILRRQLTDALQKLDESKEDQRKEGAEYSSATKELAQSKIDCTKSLNEVRELRSEMDKLEATIRDKDAHIDSLKDELGDCKQQLEDLKLDLIHSDDQGIKLEREVKRMEEELLVYKEAAEKDEQEGGSENLRRLQSDNEHRLQDEKERRLYEKQKKLDAKIKQFEEERERVLQQQKEREQGSAERQNLVSEKQKVRDGQRKEMDDTINSRLKELEENNAALQGRLKSEQLDSSMKLKKKDESIGTLQKSLTEVKKQLAERDADPEGVVSLQRDVESAKTETATVNEDLAEAQRLNGMLEEEIEDLRRGSAELNGDLETLQKATASSTTEMDKLRIKLEEWQNKSSEWTDKGK
jgi:colicin import membrane protein